MDRYSKNTFRRLPFYFRATDSDSVAEKFFNTLDSEFANWDIRIDELENARNIDNVPKEELRFKAESLGTEIPKFFPEDNWRKWVRQYPFLVKRKGAHGVMEDAIRVVLGIDVIIKSLWNDESKWTVGKSKVGIDTFIWFGDIYKPTDLLEWKVGTGLVGISTKVGPFAINEDLPRTFRVFVNIIPTDEQFQSIVWILDNFKASEEHYEIVLPVLGVCWVLPESKLALDTVLCNKCWIVGHSLVEISTVVCGDTEAPPLFYTDDVSECVLPPATDPPTIEPSILEFICKLPPATSSPTQTTAINCDLSVITSPISANGVVVTTVGNLVP